MNGGNLPLAGRYASVGTAHASALRVFELAIQHLAELDFAVGVVPFAAALLAGYALVRSGFPRRALVFASVAVASTVWLLLEVAFDAAAYDATSSHPRAGSGLVDLPRLHERYLIYVMPLFFVALVVALPLLRAKIPLRLHLIVAAVAALLPLSIPFGTVINNTNGADTFALRVFGRTVRGEVVAIPHAGLIVVIVSAVIALGYVRAAAQPIPSLAVFVTALVLLVLSVLALGQQTSRVRPAALGVPPHKNWVDRIVGHQPVGLVGAAGVTALALHETAFWNASITRLYYTCRAAFGPDYGEQPLPLGQTVNARYVVVPAALSVGGRVLARDSEGKLVLLAPAKEELTVSPSAGRCAS
jgi:hypothetical protein